MYHISPLSIVSENIDLPKCMYHIKPLNDFKLESVPQGLTVTQKRVKMDPEFQEIEDRQLQVIARLTQLRDSVDNLIKKAGAGGGQHKGGKVSAKPPQKTLNNRSSNTTGASSALSNVTLPSELVIEANPNRPPLSLLFFRNVAPTFRIINHTHSSCSQKIDGKLVSLFSNDTSSTNSSTIRVVWKNGSGSRLTPPTLGSSGVEGESNVARYLSRVLAKSDDSLLNYDALPLEDLVFIDDVLDSSNLVDVAPDQFLNSLQAYVQRVPSSRTIADFVGYSTLRYLTKQQPKKSLQKSLVDWMNCLTNEVPSLS